MQSLGKLGFAVTAAALALVLATAGESAVPPVAPVAPAPVAPAMPPVAPTGGWTRQGWSDDATLPRTESVPAEEMAPPRQDLVPPSDPSRVTRASTAAPRWPERDDWRRQTWDGGQGNAFRYRRGERLPNAFAAPAYVVRDWRGFGLPAPGPTRDWIRYYDDAVLVDRYGTVVDALPGVAWDRAVSGYAGQAYPAYQAYPASGPVTGAAPRDPRFGTAYDEGECRRAADGGFLPGVCTQHAADGSVLVTTTTAPVVTTHTTVVNRAVPTAKRKAVTTRKRAVRPAR